MVQIPNWENHIVPQKRRDSGCIPWGFELLLRIEGAPLIDFDGFQDRFDLDKREGQAPRNNFRSVADAISQQYPHVSFAVKDFPRDKGADKVAAVEHLVAKGKPVLVSMPLKPLGYPGWHIMPVVEISEGTFLLFHSVSSIGVPQLLPISRDKLIKVHGEYEGGHDIAHVEGILNPASGSA